MKALSIANVKIPFAVCPFADGEVMRLDVFLHLIFGVKPKRFDEFR
jgi:hypothetical protein